MRFSDMSFRAAVRSTAVGNGKTAKFRRVTHRPHEKQLLKLRRLHRPKHFSGGSRTAGGPGGPGWLPTQASLRSVRALIRAYGSSDDGFAMQLNTACPDCYPGS